MKCDWSRRASSRCSRSSRSARAGRRTSAAAAAGAGSPANFASRTTPTMRERADVLRLVEAEVLADRILVALEEALDERLVDDRDRRGRFVVRLRERAPARHRHAEVLQVVRADAIPRRARVARRASAADGRRRESARPSCPSAGCRARGSPTARRGCGSAGLRACDTSPSAAARCSVADGRLIATRTRSGTVNPKS